MTVSESVQITPYEYHEIANIFPLIQDAEFSKLKEDIAAHGVREPVWLFEGKILDGRNRYRAAKEVNKAIEFQEFDGDRVAALDFVWSLNRRRRHLTSSQSAIADAEYSKLHDGYAALREAAKSAQVGAGEYGGEGGRGNKKTPTELIPEGFTAPIAVSTPAPQFSFVETEPAVSAATEIPTTTEPFKEFLAENGFKQAPTSVQETPKPKRKKSDGETRQKRAKLAGTNAKYIELADKLVAERPDLAEQVKTGEKTLTQVQRELKKDQVAQKVKDLPNGKYRVIYADPPWSYNDTREGLSSADGQSVDRASTAAKDHYPTMTMDELKALDVKKLAADDCVLFCWATFPLLPDALEVVKAWGFKYKTSFIWDKQRGSFGHYHTAEAEILFVCTRGSATPDADKKEKQVQRWERAEHSRKPNDVRAMIDRMYVHGPRIELFRRGDAPEGWHVWGAEIEEVVEAA